MSEEEFKKFIESIGFEYDGYNYIYNGCENCYEIDLYNNCYDFYNGYKWLGLHAYNNLTPFENYFKKKLRSIKLKKILS